MSPRYRRALIPGLLLALLVLVVVAALTGQARADGTDGAPGRVSTITDDRLPETSGLVVSTRDAG